MEHLKNFIENVFLWRSLEKFLWRPFFFWRSPEKFLWRPFFFSFGEHLSLCPWSLALASSIPVLGLERVCPRKGCPWPWPRIFFVSLALALASSLVSSTPPLLICGTIMMKKRSSVAMRNQSCRSETANIDWELPQTSCAETVANSKPRVYFNVKMEPNCPLPQVHWDC